ncbi:carboxylesterase family protein [Burkholderia sp. Ac-20379]|uniref:carboxylesterase family protein n=1 Tax=Burkholderia sp. Ac-20379 TaxID=2703900 RepID=UPI00197DCF47|nr:carboxylesterase family protein [Burkholderia sp. Ac-20379]
MSHSNFNRRAFLKASLGGSLALSLPVVSQAATRTATFTPHEPLPVTGGLISGAPSPSAGVRAYLGIPYAAPPVGGLRWRPPQPVTPWSGVRRADRQGPSPCAPPSSRDSVYYYPSTPMSEDCLYLNVWVPQHAGPGPLPVMVWIYGGEWVYGTSSSTLYQGDALAQQGVIVVSFNYRVGVPGFFAYPELSAESGHGVSGNYGLLDQQAALRWVRDNIHAFGGDPGNVTLFGQSAGSFSVSYQMVSPLSKGLFHRAIGQSGAGMIGYGNLDLLQPLAKVEQTGLQFAQSLGATNLAQLRALPVAQLVKAGGAGPTFNPAVDGWVLTGDPYRIFAAGQQHKLPLLAGFNLNEGSVFPPIGGDTPAGLQQTIGQLYGDYATAANALYPADSTLQAIAQGKALFADQTLTWNTAAWASLNRQTSGQAVYFYHFAHAPSLPKGKIYLEGPAATLGAFHGSEIAYAMRTLRANPWKTTAADLRLSDTMSRYWTNFARNGDPNGPRLPAWPRFDPAAASVMQFDATDDRLGPLSRAPELQLISLSTGRPIFG